MVILTSLISSDLVNSLIEASVEILKLQETAKSYTGAYDQIMLSTLTSGWTVCKEYAATLWVKKISWSSNYYDMIFRLSNNAS